MGEILTKIRDGWHPANSSGIKNTNAGSEAEKSAIAPTSVTPTDSWRRPGVKISGVEETFDNDGASGFVYGGF